MHTVEVEQFAALAENWRQARAIDDQAASEAFEDELHARISKDELGQLRPGNAPMHERPAAEADGLRTVLERMWDNASARLD